jgi:hypothetical protein
MVQGKNSVTNMPITWLVKWIDLSTNLGGPLIDRTDNSSIRVTTTLESTDDAQSLQKKLNAFGLNLVESIEEIEMLIITQNNKPKQ